MLSALDYAIIKIDKLEKEDTRKQAIIIALRCRLKEVLDNPLMVVVHQNEE